MISEKTEDFKLVKHRSRKRRQKTGSRSTELNLPEDDYTVEEILRCQSTIINSNPSICSYNH